MTARRSSALGAVALVAGLLTGCSDSPVTVAVASSTSAASTGASSSSSSPSQSSTSSEQSATSSSSAVPTYAVGDCLDGTDFVKVSCTQLHWYEVSAVVPNTQFADDPVKRDALRSFTCMNALATYIGGPPVGTRTIDAAVTSVVDPQADRRFVCLAQSFYNPHGDKVDFSLRNIVKKQGWEKWKLCTSTLPSSAKLDLISCNSPHVAEAVTGFNDGPFDKPYPGQDKLNKTALQRCSALGKKYLGNVSRRDVVVSQNSAGPGPWAKGTHITGCFVQTDGTEITKSLRNIGHRPLASLK